MKQKNIDTKASKLTVGKEHCGLDMYCTLSIDGVKKRRFKSESFLGGFAYMLMYGMGARNNLVLSLGDLPTVKEWDGGLSIFTGDWYNINSVIKESPLKVTMADSSSLNYFTNYDQPNPTYVAITGASDFNGNYLGEKLSTNQIALYNRDGTPVDGTGAGTISNGLALIKPTRPPSDDMVPNYYYDANDYKYNDMLAGWQLMVGRSNNPVSIEDVYLWDRIMHGVADGQLNHGTISYSPLVTDKPSSRFTISKPLTNQGATAINVNEIGIESSAFGTLGEGGYKTQYDNGFSNAPGIHMVRDVLASTLTVPAGSTLTVDYELVIRLSPDTQNTEVDGSNGGFLLPFMQIIRAISTTSNITPNIDINLGNAGGGNRRGIYLGADNQFTSMTDASLDINNINSEGYGHGVEDGQLFYHDQGISQCEYDLVNNKAVFELSRIVENRSAVSAVIREKGLFADSGLIARMALDAMDEFTIAPGEYKKVKIIVEVIA
jgi:hypothetical protein